MDPEAIKELLTAISNLGGDAKDVFIWYMATRLGESLLIGLTIFGVATLGAMTIRFGIKTMSVGGRIRQASGLYSEPSNEQLLRACMVVAEQRDYIRYGGK